MVHDVGEKDDVAQALYVPLYVPQSLYVPLYVRQSLYVPLYVPQLLYVPLCDSGGVDNIFGWRRSM